MRSGPTDRCVDDHLGVGALRFRRGLDLVLLRALLLLVVSLGAVLVLAATGVCPGGAPARARRRVRERRQPRHRGLRRRRRSSDAEEGGYDAVVILLDTPGGLSEAMRDIYQRMLASPLPVIVYVSPDGARAASAGVWIVQAADVAAMAPQTNHRLLDADLRWAARTSRRICAEEGRQRRGRVPQERSRRATGATSSGWSRP